MKCHLVKARDIPDAWFQLIDLCYKHGRDYRVGLGSFAGVENRRELDHITVHITNPESRPLLPEIPDWYGIPNPVPEGMAYVDRYLPYILTDHVEPGEQYTYGQRLFSPMDIQVNGEKVSSVRSQVDEVIDKFKQSYETNQCCMSISCPQDIQLQHPPCLRSIDCRIYGDSEKLHFIMYFRSWDLWSGFPANLAALVSLQEWMAEQIGVETGEFICSSKGLHMYGSALKLARIRLGEKTMDKKQADELLARGYAETLEEWWFLFNKHKKDIIPLIGSQLGDLELKRTIGVISRRECEELHRIMQTAWNKLPDSPHIHDIPGFSVMCDLLSDFPSKEN